VPKYTIATIAIGMFLIVIVLSMISGSLIYAKHLQATQWGYMMAMSVAEGACSVGLGNAYTYRLYQAEPVGAVVFNLRYLNDAELKDIVDYVEKIYSDAHVSASITVIDGGVNNKLAIPGQGDKVIALRITFHDLDDFSVVYRIGVSVIKLKRGNTPDEPGEFKCYPVVY